MNEVLTRIVEILTELHEDVDFMTEEALVGSCKLGSICLIWTAV